MANELGLPHRAALLALMGTGGEASNKELADVSGFTIRKEVREALADRSLITFSREGNGPFVHMLTRPGWAWCTEELQADPPARPGSLGGALYAVLRGLNGALEARNLTLLDFLSSGVVSEPGDIEAEIRAAYRKLAAKPRDWVRLVDLRFLLNGTADVDGGLRRMSRSGQARLAPDSNRRGLTAADHEAAIRIGGQDNHQIMIEES